MLPLLPVGGDLGLELLKLLGQLHSFLVGLQYRCLRFAQGLLRIGLASQRALQRTATTIDASSKWLARCYGGLLASDFGSNRGTKLQVVVHFW